MPDPTPAAPATTSAAPPPPAPPAKPAAAPPAAPAVPDAAKAAPAATDLLAETPTEAPETPSTTGDQPKGETPPDGEYKVTVPEGLALDPVLLDAVTPLFKEYGLSTEQASKIATVAAEFGAKAQEAANERWVTTTQEWVEAVKVDKEVGGADWQKKVATAFHAGQKYGGEDFKKFLSDFPGIGSHPGLVKLLYRVGLRVKEDSISGASGAPAGSSEDADLRTLYKNSPDLFAKKE